MASKRKREADEVAANTPLSKQMKTDDDLDVSEEMLSSEDDGGRASARAGRSRKKSAKVLEMEEFELAEKKQTTKKDVPKKVKPPTSPVFLNQKTSPKNAASTSPIRSPMITQIMASPISTLKIKDIQTSPKVEQMSPVAVTKPVSPRKKTVTIVAPKSPISASAVSALAGHSPDSKSSVIKLLLNSPSQNTTPMVSTTVAQVSPTATDKLTKSNKKTKSKAKGAKQAAILVEETQEMQQIQHGLSPVTQALNINTGMVKTEQSTLDTITYLQSQNDSSTSPLGIKMEPTFAKSMPKETKSSKKGKKVVAVKEEGVFAMPPMPAPNVIHVGPMTMGLEMKSEPETSVMKKKKGKSKAELESERQREKERLEMEEEMMDNEYGLDMSEIELGGPGDDSFMDIDDDDSLMLHEQEFVSMKPKSAAKSAKKKGGKTKGGIQLGDIPDTDLVMDFARMKADKPEDKKKKHKQVKQETLSLEAEKSLKKKRAPTAYMLWCNVNRPRVVADNPGIDFSSISKTLGEMWSNLSEKDKMLWKRKAKKAAGKGSTLITTGKANAVKGAVLQLQQGVAKQSHVTIHKTTPQLASMVAAKQVSKAAVTMEDVALPVKGFSNDPVDVAAHLKIVGESLSIIGMRLQEHKGLIAVQGSLSVLLDSMMCAIAPLMCLTAVLPETDGLPHKTHMKNLDNIAYIMPGL